ncbi:Uncharacterised protein [Yersinia frederiksenii]|nr:Uncharacterised protein [Yersinia frederiksenii]
MFVERDYSIEKLHHSAILAVKRQFDGCFHQLKIG